MLFYVDVHRWMLQQLIDDGLVSTTASNVKHYSLSRSC